MDRESVERLRFDRRLQRRNGWVEPDVALANIEALPDVSDKMTTAAELEAEEAAAAEAEEAAAEAEAPVATFGSPAPVAGDFSSPSYSSPGSPSPSTPGSSPGYGSSTPDGSSTD